PVGCRVKHLRRLWQRSLRIRKAIKLLDLRLSVQKSARQSQGERFADASNGVRWSAEMCPAEIRQWGRVG
ncbi:MAG: hypothetical protein V3U36_02940, partial [Anaerolineales bacterium]